ncbi:hypothetical protein BH11VER1_BH11VER1_25910 [soil metagenome]
MASSVGGSHELEDEAPNPLFETPEEDCGGISSDMTRIFSNLRAYGKHEMKCKKQSSKANPDF